MNIQGDDSIRRSGEVIGVLFFISGFCGLLYQIIWTRLAFTAFGIITPVLSVVLSTFMFGFALGSWLAGPCIQLWYRRTTKSALFLYSLTELAIGTGALFVPRLFQAGRTWLLGSGEMNSATFLTASALVLAICILPWCVLMGSTFPVMMAFMREQKHSEDSSFSFLYGANVFGALVGTVLCTVFLIETFGFRATLQLAACLNVAIAVTSAFIGRGAPPPLLQRAPPPMAPGIQSTKGPADSSSVALWILFITGFTTMAFEVVWTRAFIMVLKTNIYSFAVVLTVYLLATWAGALVCRRIQVSTTTLLATLSLSSWLPILVNDPRFPAHPIRVAVSLFPVCAILGGLTPHLIDHLSLGDPARAGRAYAFNTLGCIAGPLVASYLLLPAMGVRYAMILLCIPLFALLLVSRNTFSRRHGIAAACSLGLCFYAIFASLSYEEGFLLFYKDPVFRRDHSATVVSCGRGMHKQLFVNGIPMTNQTSITKVMAHLTLGFIDGKPDSALTICLGMGTTYRSLLTWDIRTTAVELIPSVKDAFPYYFDDAPAVLANPLGHIEVDDGRRYLDRTLDSYDAIIIDPPPPVETAGSSLLYSIEFYETAKKHLKHHGILQQWIPATDPFVTQAVARSLAHSFPYVKVFLSSSGYGYHFLASGAPLITPSAKTFIARVPALAQSDFLEWRDGKRFRDEVQEILKGELPIGTLLSDGDTLIRDDLPYNEYFLLRHWRLWRNLR